MLNKGKSWFKRLMGDDSQSISNVPEVMGLHLGGSFEIDRLKLSIIEPHLMIEKAAACHIIQAVGQVQLDHNSQILRFYTDDDAFLQIVMEGGTEEHHITDVKLWYFYDTRSVGSASQWEQLLDNGLSQPSYQLEETLYQRIWEGVDNQSPPVAMTEKTWSEGAEPTTTDQFVMLYERQVMDDEYEALMLAGEEKIIDNRKDHCMVISTGFNVSPADIKING